MITTAFIEQCALFLGYGVMLVAALALLAALFFTLSGLVGIYLWRLTRKLEEVYMLHVIQYWFKRMDRDGTHVLRKDHQDKLYD